MKTILVPTDFSANAYAALQYAAQLYAETECTFIIVHSFENQVSHMTSRVDIAKTEAVVAEFYSTYEEQCDEVKHAIAKDVPNANHSYKTIATSLTLARAINKLIVKEQATNCFLGSFLLRFHEVDVRWHVARLTFFPFFERTPPSRLHSFFLLVLTRVQVQLLSMVS